MDQLQRPQMSRSSFYWGNQKDSIYDRGWKIVKYNEIKIPISNIPRAEFYVCVQQIVILIVIIKSLIS